MKLVETFGGEKVCYEHAVSLQVYQSDIIPREVFLHGFPERHGGVSTGKMASLNFGTHRGDTEENVQENIRRVAEHVGFQPSDLLTIRHVHGKAVWRVDESLPDPAEFDGLVSHRSGDVLGAFGADCVPILLADPVAKVCGAAHAGWKGTVLEIGVEMVRRMGELGSRPENIRVALGPSISVDSFEVGAEVAVQFEEAFQGATGVVVQGPKKQHVNLQLATRISLEGCGVKAEHIDSNPPDTCALPERFFSYRRDGAKTGSHLSFIGLR